MNTTCFHGEIRKISTFFGRKKCLIWSYEYSDIPTPYHTLKFDEVYMQILLTLPFDIVQLGVALFAHGCLLECI